MRHFLCLLLAAFAVGVQADEALSSRQAGVAQRYQQLEELLLRLADVEAAENPERAVLLRRAASESREKFVLETLKDATESLKTRQFQKAVESQDAASKELKALLNLLMSEDRTKRIRDEQERYSKLSKDLKRVLNNQRSARARTENGADLEDVSDEQKSVTERSEELTQRLKDENEPIETEGDERKQGESKSGETNKDDAKSGESKNDEAKNGEEKQQDEKAGKDDDTKEGDKDDSKDRKSEPGKSSDEKSGDKKSSSSDQKSPEGSKQQQDPAGQSEQSDQQQQQAEQQQSQQQQQQAQPQTPEQDVEQQLKKAIEKMKEAQQELEQAKREEATEKQRQAEENLRAAIDRLDRILRQLREEEMERELAKLESRLRKMTAMQTKVLDDTVALAATPVAQRIRQTDVKAGDLAFEEKKITMEADRAMLLLREEGSSVAFPEVLSQIRSDTTRVADLLAQTKIDAITQGIQQDILAALEEMIAAVQKAQRDLEKKKQQQQQGKSQPSQQGEQPLVEALAELKLIRTMETRIKSTTDRYSSLLESGESKLEEVEPLVQDLSDRQNRLYQITRDLVLKRNK
ncbi:MAG: hypothetical protein AB8B91_14380 [Rubripirellula sp.]